MQRHRSPVSPGPQQTIDSLPPISDFSPNLISFSPASPMGPRARTSLSGLHVHRVRCAHVHVFFPPTVNREPNLLFVIIIIIFRHLINHNLSRPAFVESQQSKVIS